MPAAKNDVPVPSAQSHVNPKDIVGLTGMERRRATIVPDHGSAHLARTHGKMRPICRYNLPHIDKFCQLSSRVYQALGSLSTQMKMWGEYINSAQNFEVTLLTRVTVLPPGLDYLYC